MGEKKIERRENSRDQTSASSSSSLFFLSLALSLLRFSFVLLPLHCLYHFILTIKPETSLLPSLSFYLFLSQIFFFLGSSTWWYPCPHSPLSTNPISRQTHFIPISHFQEKTNLSCLFNNEPAFPLANLRESSILFRSESREF